MAEGQIRKALSGFYYVYADGKVYQTRGRGVFRKQNLTPLVGDYVVFESGNQDEGVIKELLPRKNELKRPPVANVDVGIVVMSAVEPTFSTQLLDRFLVTLESNHMEALIYISKMDLLEDKESVLRAVSYYEGLGYPCLLSSSSDSVTQEEREAFAKKVEGKLVVLIGQSGAGKSTLLNKLSPELSLETGEVSLSLGRGKHTTRHVELLPLYGGLLADTPGFSSLNFDDIEAEELPFFYPDFREVAPECRFNGCLHQNEPGCKVKQLVAEGTFPEERYKNYLLFLEEIQNRKPDYSKKK